MTPFAQLCATLLATAAPFPQSEHAPDYESYLAHIAAAESALRLGEMDAVRRWLDGAPAERRGFEWSWLDARSDESAASWTASNAPLTSLDVASDSERVVIGTAGGAVAVHELATGRSLARMKGHLGEVYCVRFDSAGERVVSAAHDRIVRVWDARTGGLLESFDGHGYPVGGAAFSPDGELIASCSYERPEGGVVGTVHVWNAASGEILETHEGGAKPLSSIAWTSDGTRFAAGSWDFCVFLWTLGSDSAPRSYAVPDEGLYNAVDAIAFSPDGTRVAAGSKDRTARVWDVESGSELAVLRGHSKHVAAVAFSPDGALVATGSLDQTVRLWNARDGSEVGVLRGHLGAVRSLAFPPAGGALASASTDGSVRLWNTSTSWYGGIERRNESARYVVLFDPEERRLATCGYDGRVELWDVATWEPLVSWQAHPPGNSCHMLAFDPEGRLLYTGSHDGTVAIWDSITLEEQGRLEHEKGLECFALSPDGTRLAVAESDGRIWMWDLGTREHLFTYAGHSGTVNDIVFRPDGVELASTSSDKTARILAANNGAELAVLSHFASVGGATYLLDGVSLVTVDESGGVRRWNAQHRMETLVRIGDNAFHHLALSPDGSRLAACGNGVTLIDPEGCTAVATLRPHRDTTWNVGFGPSGERLASCSWDGTLAVSDARRLTERLAERNAALEAAEPARLHVEAQIDAGRSVREIADALWSDTSLDPDERWARLFALTRWSAAQR